MQRDQPPGGERVEVFVKIRPPSQDELYSASTKAQMATRNPRSPSPTAASIRRAIPMKTSLLKDFPLSFFALDSPDARKVFLFQNPIPKKLLDDNIKSETEFENLRQTVFSSSTPFEFNRAFSMNQNNQSIFDERVKPLIYRLLQGQSSAVFLYGPSHSGKNYLLKGEEGRDKGLSIHALDELFKLIHLSKQSQNLISEKKSFQVFGSISCVYQDLHWDLIPRNSKPFDKQKTHEHDIDEEQLPLNHEFISNTEDFKNLLRKATKELKLLSTKHKLPALSAESSIVVSILLTKNVEETAHSEGFEQESYISFVKLPDVDASQKNNDIELLFGKLKAALVRMAQSPKQEGGIWNQRDKLLENIPAFQVDDPFVHFICCLPASIQLSHYVTESLEFASQIYSEIRGKSKSIAWNSGDGLIRYASKPQTGFSENQDTAPRPREEINPHQNAIRNSKKPHEVKLLERESSSPDQVEESQDYEEKQTENDPEQYLKTLEKSIDGLRKVIFGKLQEALRKGLELSAADPKIKEQEEPMHQTEILEVFMQTLKQKENLEIEAHKVLKSNVNQLKEKNKSLFEEIDYLTHLVSERDEVIAHYQTEVSLSHNQLTASNKTLLDQQIKEENMVRSKEDLVNEIAKLKRKFRSAEVEYASNLDKLSAEHKKAIEALSRLNQENEKLKKKNNRERGIITQEEERFTDLCVEMNKLKEELAKKEQILDEWRVNGELQAQIITNLKHKLHEEKSMNRILTDEHANLAVVIDNLKKSLARVETDNEILTKRHEAEKELIEEGKLLEISKSQQKQKKTTQKLKRAEETISKLEKELVLANQDRERARGVEENLIEARDQMYTQFQWNPQVKNQYIRGKMLKDIESLQNKNDELAKERADEKQKDADTIKSLQEQVEKLSKEICELEKQISNLNSEKQELIEEQDQKTILLDKYESHLEYLQTNQTEEIDSMQMKITEFVEQINDLRIENQQKADMVSKLVQKLALAEKERDEYLQNCLEFKKENKILRRNFKQIDEKMKHLIESNTIKARNQRIDLSNENVDRSNTRTQQKLWDAVSKDYSQDEYEETA